MTPGRLGTAYFIAAAASLVGASECLATVYFQNRGVMSGWDATFVEHNGSVQQVANLYYEGPDALKATQVYDAGYTGRYHAEWHENNMKQRYQTRFYGFAFRLQSNWEWVNQRFTISQFIADFSNTGCDDWMPSTMIWVSGSQIHTRLKSGTACAQTTTNLYNVGSISAGTWHRVEIHANWRSDSTGYFKLWRDGTKTLERYNVATTVADDRPFQFRVGLYANSWHDDGYMEGSQASRQIWFDEIGVGSTFAEADPNQW